MVTALDSGLNGPGSSPSRGHCLLCSGTRHFISQCLSLSSQVYKLIPANLILGTGNSAMD